MTAEEPPAAEPARCPACLAAVEPGQVYCLECGERLAQPGIPRTSQLREAVRRRGAPALVVAGVALVVAGAALAWTLARGDSSVAGTIATPATPSTLTAGLPPTSAVTPPSTVAGGGVTTFSSTTGPGATDTLPGEGSTSTAPTTTTTPTTPTTPTTARADDDWPVGRSGYAVMLLSKEEARFGRSYMESRRAAARAKGLDRLGILNSDGYSSLNAGYWVLYQGPFDTFAAARAAALVAKTKGFGFAYPRRVSA